MFRIIDARTTLVLTAFLTIASVNAQAQVTIVEGENGQPTVYKMTVSPAPEPQPALKYRFLVPPVDQIHANAATFYYKSMVMEEPRDYFRDLSMEPLSNDVDAWLSMPLDKLPKQEVTQKVPLVVGSKYWIQPLREACRCDYCDWEDAIREDGVATLLPQAQKMRSVARALALRARLEMSKGNLDQAVSTLQLGYALSRNMSHAPSLVQCLIGMAIQNILDDQTRTMIAAENSPNLYWAVTDLAYRPIEIKQALSYESKLWPFTVHLITDLDRQTMSSEAVLKLAKEIPNITDKFGFQNNAQIFFWAAVLEPEARKYLLAHGYSPPSIDAMPVLQVVLLYRWKQFEIVRDNCFKYLELPDDEIRDAIARSDESVRTAELRNEGSPFTQLLPAIYAANYARLRSLRHSDILRVVEALRIYAAENGHWPEKLDEIKNVPIPRDPYSDKPFVYSLDGATAIISTVPDSKNKYSSLPQRYELTLRAAAKK